MTARRRNWLTAIGVLAALAVQACRPDARVVPAPQAPAGDASSEDAQPAPEQSGITNLLDVDTEEYLQLHEPWDGDYDVIASGERRFLRALVPYSRTLYFLSGAEQAGVAFESLREFERVLAQGTPKGKVPPKIVIIPTTRERLLPALAEGMGDIAIGALTITPERRNLADFSLPTVDDVRELLVTGPGAQPVASLDDLAGREVHVRRSSSYHDSLIALGESLRARGREPPRIVVADERLETEDLLQMVDAGVIPATVADEHIAKLWRRVYKQLAVHEDIPLRTGAQLAWAVRRNAPGLLSVVNDFVKGHREGTLFGNVIIQRYYGEKARLLNPVTEAEARKFRTVVEYLRRYAGQYDFDWLLIGAQAYQESRLDNTRRSSAGAVGIMQIKPSTAADVGIKDVRPIDRNIEAGVKYLRFMADRYFADEAMDELNRELFAMASYNAGPARVAKLRREAAERGLDPNQWFRNVEIVAARRVGRETVDYVSNIYKYYVAYKALAAAAGPRTEKVPAN
jgi:membrane-bound lytic murein transglycosylase MltF